MKTLNTCLNTYLNKCLESLFDDEDALISNSNSNGEDEYLKTQLFDLVSKMNHINARTYSSVNFHLDYSTNTLEINYPSNFTFELIVNYSAAEANRASYFKSFL